MKRRVAITGLGLVCSQGESPDQVFDAWCAGQSGIGLHSIGEEPYSASLPYALCAGFDAAAHLGASRITKMDRVSQLSAVAAGSAWRDAGLDDLSADLREQTCVMWGTGSGGTQTTERSYRDLFVKGRARISPLTVVLGMANAAASHIAIQLGLGGDCLTYSVACSSSTVAVGEAFRRIRAGDADLAIAGGAEAAMPFAPVKAWESMQVLAAPAGDAASASCRPFHPQRSGLVLGEGSAALVLEDWDSAKRRGARIYAEIIGYGGGCDHGNLAAPDSAGQLRTARRALRDAQMQPHEVQYVNAHGTATRDGDTAEIATLRELFGEHAPQVMVSSTKSMHGHLIGGAGAIELMATALTLHRQVIPPTAGLDEIDPVCVGVDHVRGQARAHPGLQTALTNSFAFGGSNAVLVLRAADRAA